MSYHYKDIYRILIPGIVLFFVLQYLIKDNSSLIESLIPEDTTNKAVFYVFFIPIAGFLLGFVNNFLSALCEKVVYLIIPRPSRILLRDSEQKHLICLSPNTIKSLKSKVDNLKINKEMSTEDAYNVFSVANQHLKERNEIIETNYNYMIFARNMFLPSIGIIYMIWLLVDCSSCPCQYRWIIYILSFVIILLFQLLAWQWYSYQHTKYILVDYANLK